MSTVRRVRRNRGKSGRVNLESVAALAGVSTATVSRVLNENRNVHPDNKKKVLAAVRSLGYVPNPAARALASLKFQRIAVIVPTLRHSLYARMIEELQRCLHRSRYNLLVFSYDYDLELEVEQVKAALSGGVDGFILIGNKHRRGLWAAIEAFRVPFVTTLVAKSVRGGAAVGFDNRTCGALLANHLLDLGHRDFAVIAGLTRPNDRAAERLRGILDALSDRGVKVPGARIIEVPYSIESGRQAMSAILEQSARPTAVICGNDAIAFGAFLETQARKVTVPGELSIGGFGDLEISRLSSPRLTTVRLPAEDIANAAGEAIVSRIEGEAYPNVTEFELSLVVRESTAPPPGRRQVGARPLGRGKPRAKLVGTRDNRQGGEP